MRIIKIAIVFFINVVGICMWVGIFWLLYQKDADIEQIVMVIVLFTRYLKIVGMRYRTYRRKVPRRDYFEYICKFYLYSYVVYVWIYYLYYVRSMDLEFFVDMLEKAIILF
jgi:hypothetical protein